MTNNGLILCKVLRDGVFYSTHYEAGEIFLAHRIHVSDWTAQNRVEPLLEPEKQLRETLKVLLQKNPAVTVYEILEDAVVELAIESYNGLGRIKWIENLFKTPVNDGRHRIVDLILLPYCKNYLGLNETETVEKIMPWLNASNKLSPSKLTEQDIRAQFKRTPSD